MSPLAILLCLVTGFSVGFSASAVVRHVKKTWFDRSWWP